MPQYQIDITEQRSISGADLQFLEQAVFRILQEQQIDIATLSIVLVDDVEIHELNRQYLGHDYPTDVISFLLSPAVGQNGRSGPDCEPHPEFHSIESPVKLEGELIVSVETAEREAVRHGWSPLAELLLYVVHGILHLCGYDDLTDEARPVMRSRERDLLAIWGYCPTGLES